MKGTPNISDAEWEVMRSCWLKSAPCTANEIVKALEQSTHWKPNTIKTLIGRFVNRTGPNNERKFGIFELDRAQGSRSEKARYRSIRGTATIRSFWHHFNSHNHFTYQYIEHRIMNRVLLHLR